MSRFHSLEVTDIHKETRDAVVVTLKPSAEDAEAFAFTQGQYLTFRRDFDGQEIRRSYSICAGLDEGKLRVGIKRVDGGAFSTWANSELKLGDHLETMTPAGQFFTPIEPEKEKNYLGFAGGSGITPVLSIIKTVLAREPNSTFTLIYANRQVSSIMFREELEDIKNNYLGRFSVIHVLESDSQEIDLFTGMLDAEKLASLFKLWVDIDVVDTAFICGPEPMMKVIAESLRNHGLVNEQIKFELFKSSQPGRLKQAASSAAAGAATETCTVSITLDGATQTIKMPKQGQVVLDAALENNMDVPYACKAGVCSTCKARVLEGEVEMASNDVLEDHEVRDGYVLSCQSTPLTDKVTLSYDE